MSQASRSSSRITRSSARESVASEADDDPPPLEATRPRQRNQHLPLVPEDLIKPVFIYYHFMGLSVGDVLTRIQNANLYDTNKYSLSKRSLERMKAKWKLPSTRGAGWTVANIGTHVEALREKFPNAGAVEMKKHLLRSNGVFVSRKTVLDYMKMHHPDEVANRRVRRLKRKQFYAAGVNDIWTFDQHDKWRKFELYMHVGLEPISGKLLWLQIWWTNKNPRLVCSYWVKAVEKVGGTPLLTQSDAGSENYGIANAQTVLRHSLDPHLGDTLQHRWMTGHQNVKPEIFWSQLRRRWSPGYEELLEEGYYSGIYRPADVTHRLVFHWVFIPWLQEQLDAFADMYNHSAKRRDRKSMLPNARPQLVFDSPKEYGWDNLLVPIEAGSADLEAVRQAYAQPSHDVHHLVPETIEKCLQEIYEDIGSPQCSRENIWEVYATVLNRFMIVIQQSRTTASATGTPSAIENIISQCNIPGFRDNLPDQDYVLVPGRDAGFGDDSAVIGKPGIQRRREEEAVFEVDGDEDQEEGGWSMVEQDDEAEGGVYYDFSDEAE